MKFYCEPSNDCEYNATPFRIDVGGLRLSSKSKDAFPFVLDGSGNVVFGSRHSEHYELKNKYSGELVMDGRCWLNSGAISFWGIYNKPLYEVQANAEKVVNAISSKTGIPLSKMRLFFECDWHNIRFAVEMGADEFLSIKPSAETIDNVLFNLMMKSGCDKNGIAYRDLFRHLNITESKTNKNMKKHTIKLNEDTLRQIVAESVKKVLKEYGDDDASPIWNDSHERSGYEIFTEWGERAAHMIMQEINSKRNEYAEDLFDDEAIEFMCWGFNRELENIIKNGDINPHETTYRGKTVYSKNGQPWKMQ